MATNTATYTVRIKNNPKFCGKGAGGVQFANGKAEGVSPRMAEWFKEHKGYEVVEEAVAKDISKMKVDELIAYANENGIELGDAKKKEDILKIIKGE